MTTIDVEPQVNESAIVILRQYWYAALRQKWVVLTCMALTLGAALLYCQFAQKMFRSETIILIEEQKVPESYVQGVAERNVEQRIYVLKRQVMSEPLLGAIVKEMNLYPDVIREHGLEAAVGRIASTIRVEMVTNGPYPNPAGRTLEAFSVSFAHEDPATAMEVASRLGVKFIEENLKIREQIAQGTTEFLDDEAVRLQRDLERKEEEIKRFKAQHMGELPQQIDANQRALDRLQDDLKAVREGLQRLADRRDMLETAIGEYERFGRTNPSLVGGIRQPDPLFGRLQQLREQLAKFKAVFWESYPDVITTREEIRQVEKELVELYGPDVLKPGERPLDPYLQELKRQLKENVSESAVLNRRQEMILQEKKDYMRRVDRAPAIEQELLILMRDYDNMKINYQSLLDKRLNARVAENLEKRQKGAQFRIIDPANFPRAPETPNQRRVMFLGFILGSLLSVGLIIAREQLNPRFLGHEDLERILGPQILAVIPDFSQAFWRRLLPPPSMLAMSTEKNGNANRRMLSRRSGGPDTGRSGQYDFIVKWFPASLIAEQYRVAAARLIMATGKDHPKIVAVTSAVKGEGKTTTVINLGYTLARDFGKRTVLVDCDIKCPALDRYTESMPQYGLADRLSGEVPIEACLAGFGEVPCWILPVGSGEVRSTDILKPERLTAVLGQLRMEFDYILINTPPILPLADMNILATHADLLVMVVRANSTPQAVVKRALTMVGGRIPVHVVLNAVRTNALPVYMYDYAPRVMQAS